MTAARLASLAAHVADPATGAEVYRALGFNVALPSPDTAEIRFDDGLIIQLLRAATPSRTHFGFRVRDITDAAQRLSAAGHAWKVNGSNHISFEHGDCLIYALQADPNQSPGLIASTHFASDVIATTRWYRAVGLSVGHADAELDTAWSDPDEPQDPSVDIFLDNAVVQLWPSGIRPITLVNLLISIENPAAAAVGLDELRWRYEWDGAELVTRDPDGCAVRLTRRKSF
jgi:hypothetical protein